MLRYARHPRACSPNESTMPFNEREPVGRVAQEKYIPYYPEDHEQDLSMFERMKRTPFITAGVLSTWVILGCGLYTVRSGNRRLGQKFMRARVAAQAITLAMITVGTSATYYNLQSSREGDL